MGDLDQADVLALVQWPWRVGAKLGRTVYAQVGAEPSQADVLLGFMDSAPLAAIVVADHNARLGVSRG